MTATEAAAGPDRAIEDIPLSIETIAGTGERPGGARFGSLVHALLADVPLHGDMTAALARLASAHGRLLDAERDEIASAQALVARVLAHPVLKAASDAAAADRCYRETPVTIRREDGTLIEGTVDLAFTDEEGFVVVDFKTDRELDGALDRYERQVRLYASAISSATGQRTRAVLMRI
jgi:ATP-dependent exoDNAse (exonuclease V) beta subunit